MTAPVEQQTQTATDLDPARASTRARRSDDERLLRGTSVDRFVVLERLGRGGMGAVYLAYDPELDRRVAIKLLLPMLAETPEQQARLRREAKAMARVQHPNVVPVHDVGSFEGRVFVAMAFVEGSSLAAAVPDRRTSGWVAVLEPFLQAGEGLAAAHRAGVVHRDFKPSNVMVSKDGRAQVLDFGLAHSLGAVTRETTEPQGAGRDSELTRSGQRAGTPAYMAPEQHLGEATDPRTDQFSFCVALWEALYQQRPFAGTDRAQVADAVLQGRIQRPPAAAGVPAFIPRALAKGMELDPSKRWESMDALLEALRRRPRRRARRLLASTALLGALVAGLWVGGAAKQTPCGGMEAHLEGAWDLKTRERVKAGLLATDLEYASTTWSRVEERLDAYARRWVRARTRACEATRVSGEQSEKLLDLRMACLDARLESMEATAQVLAAADAGVVKRAVSAVASLPSLEPCADSAYLLAKRALPGDPTVSAQIHDVEGQLMVALALQQAGKYDDGLEVAREALEEAEATGFGPLHAAALLRAGELEKRTSDFTAAEKTLRAGYFEAVAEEVPEVAVEAAAILVLVVGDRLHRSEEGREWAFHANAQAKAAGQGQSVEALLGLGGLAVNDADLDEARAHYERALELLTAERGQDDPSIAVALSNLGNVDNDAGDLRSARRSYERALEVWTTSLGHDHPNVGLAHNNLGTVAEAEGDYDTARDHYERALEIWLPVLGEDHTNIGVVVANLGNIAARRGEDVLARGHHERAAAIFAQTLGPRHPHVATVLANLGNNAYRLDDYEAARDFFGRALEIREESLDQDHPDVASSLVGLANVMVDTGEASDAIPMLERALEIRLQTEGPRDLLGNARYGLARALWMAETGKGRDRARSARFSAEAREDFLSLGAGARYELGRLDGWLAKTGQTVE